MSGVPLTEQEIVRYSRHIILPEVGGRGQRRIKESSVLIVGLRGTGSAAALYLAAAGVGRLSLWDPEIVSADDLGWAIAHDRFRIGQSRAESAAVALRAINPAAEVRALSRSPLDGEIARPHDVIIATMGDWSSLVSLGSPVVFAGVNGADGALTVLLPGSPGLTGQVEPEREDQAVLAASAGVIGTAAATEAVKLILGVGEPLAGRVLRYQGWTGVFR